MTLFQHLFVSFIWRDLQRNRLRSFLTVFGIALGVAVMLAINLANQTSLSHFRKTVNEISGNSTIAVFSRAEEYLDEKNLAELSFLWAEDCPFTPVIDQFIVAIKDQAEQEQDQEPVENTKIEKNKQQESQQNQSAPDTLKKPPSEVIRLLGIDIFADRAFRNFSLERAIESPDNNNKDIALLRPGYAWISTDLARRFALKPGSKLTVLVNDREEKITVAGLFSNRGAGKAFGSNLIIMDIGCAQIILNCPGKVSRIEIISPAARTTSLLAELNKKFPRLRAERPERRGEQVEKMLRSFQLNLTALSLIALLVGMFLIYNTMSISVLRRRAEIATLTALGTPRQLIFALFSAESLLLGITGSLSGIIMGCAMAQAATQAVNRTVNALYANQAAVTPEYSPPLLIMAFSAGVFLTWLAGLAPAVEAASVPPAQATRREAIHRKVNIHLKQLTTSGLLLLGAALALSLLPARNGFPVFGYLSCTLAVFGAALLAPQLLNFCLPRIATYLPGILGPEARIAARSLQGALGRTAVAIASLTIGIAMMVSLAVMIGSFRNTVAVWVSQTLRADLWIKSGSRAHTGRNGRIDEAVVEKIRHIPDVDAVDAFTEWSFEYKGAPANLGAGETNVMSKHGNLLFLNNEPASQVLTRVTAKDACIVSESFATRNNIKQGDSIEIPLADGNLSVQVEGIYYDYASDLGYVIIPRALYRRHSQDTTSTTLAVFLKKTADAESVRQEIEDALGSKIKLHIRTNKELRKEVLRVFDQTFSITYALHIISIAVAILGVMNALFAIIMESRQELTVLRYLGASNNQLTKLVMIEGGILGFCGNAGGLALGMALSQLLIHVINKQSFGWTIQFAVPYDFLGQSFMLIMLCSIISALPPAQAAIKAASPEVLRAE